MNSTLLTQDYKKIFHFFSEISAIPRGSKNNKAISDYIAQFAKDRGLFFKQDEFENVIIIKEATSGYENAPGIILQGHMDMVCEKESNSNHDFLTQGIELQIKEGYIWGNGTTLGADNGIAVAYALSLLDDSTLGHPRLEAIFTTDEEVGMDGAIGIDVSELTGKFFLNLDSEEEGTFWTSSAGGLTATCELPITFIGEHGLNIHITIQGLQGGHSGAEIHKTRTNATKLLGRLLFDLRGYINYGLIQMSGGQKDNAIPREASANIFLDPKDLEAFQNGISILSEIYKQEVKTSEPELSIEWSDSKEGEWSFLHPSSYEKVLFMLIHTPNGVQAMSSDLEGLVESSLNLGVFKIEQSKDTAVFCFSVRSSVNSYKQFVSNKLEYITNFLGGNFYIRSQYPAWEYKKESPLRDHLIRIFKNQYGYEPKLEAIHAGLECSFFAEKIKDVDIVSMGPEMHDIHTPKERLSISSAIRVYQFVEKVIEGMLYYE